MDFIDFKLDDSNRKKLWIACLGLMYSAGAFQVYSGNLTLAVTSLGAAIVFTALAYQDLNGELEN